MQCKQVILCSQESGFLLATVSSLFWVAKALRGCGCPAAVYQTLRWMMTEATPAVCGIHAQVQTPAVCATYI